MKNHDWIPGNCLRLVDYGTIDKAYRGQLLSHGLTQGIIIRVIRCAPFGGLIQIELRGVMLGLRRDDLRALCWERL